MDLVALGRSVFFGGIGLLFCVAIVWFIWAARDVIALGFVLAGIYLTPILAFAGFFSGLSGWYWLPVSTVVAGILGGAYILTGEWLRERNERREEERLYRRRGPGWHGFGGEWFFHCACGRRVHENLLLGDEDPEGRRRCPHCRKTAPSRFAPDEEVTVFEPEPVSQRGRR